MNDEKIIAKEPGNKLESQTSNSSDDAGLKGKPYLKLRSVTKKFGDFVAVEDVSLDVLLGELICFVGPSGCGKTTLLRVIAGLESATSGHVIQNDKDITKLPPSQRDFGIVFQSYALFPNLTVGKNIAYGLENHKGKRNKAEINKKVVDLLVLVGLQSHGDKYPAQLSGGEQQRVALARSLATSPGLLLLDEPLSALDAKVRVSLRREIRSLQRRLGVTTIMVTHDQEEALNISDRIIIMNQGRIEQVGTPVSVYSNPSNQFIADFIGTMNFIPIQITGKNRIKLGQTDLICETAEVNNMLAGTAAVRPEDIVVQDISGSEENAFEVYVKSMEFLGAFYRAELKTSKKMGAVSLYADLSKHRVRNQGISEGDFLKIMLPAESICVYPEMDSNE